MYNQRYATMKKLYILLLLLTTQSLIAQNYLPQSRGEVVEHTYYTLSYIEEHEQAEWVYYTLSPTSLTQRASRTDNFRADPKVSTLSATLEDYAGSGYDRGHLCPAASMAHNKVAMSESFYLSNMSPQHPSFNRGTWKKLEEHVRSLAMADSLLHVVTGAILTDSLGSIGQNGVTIPRYYYKALYSPKRGEMLGYVMENCKLDEALESYATTIDHIESLAGVDLFYELGDSVELLESRINLSNWVTDLSVEPTAITPTNETQEATSSRCQGRTSSGKQCSRTAQSGSSYCWQHQK